MAELPKILTKVPGPRSRELAARLSRVESPDTTYLSDDFPIFWERAHGCIVVDVDGNSYLDATSSFGALSVGHTHPGVVSAVSSQAENLIHGMGDVHPSRVKVELLEKLADVSPIPNPRIILGQSGSEAVEAALKTAFLATRKPGVAAFHGGYHGLSYGALDPTARPFFRNRFEEQRGRFTTHVPFGERGEIESLLSSGKFGAVLVEPVQGRGGIRIPEDGWLAWLHEQCSEFGVLLILDEIYTGFGRTGKMFACEWDKVVPDIICVGKAMGGGMPISACIGSSDLIEKAWPKSCGEAMHTSTFLGHPLACAGALAAIGVIEREGLVERSASVGADILTVLTQIAGQFPGLVVEARGRGLMLGLSMQSQEVAALTMTKCLQRGLIVLTAGDSGDVIELTPPLIISDDQAEWMLETLAAAIGDVAAT